MSESDTMASAREQSAYSNMENFNTAAAQNQNNHESPQPICAQGDDCSYDTGKKEKDTKDTNKSDMAGRTAPTDWDEAEVENRRDARQQLKSTHTGDSPTQLQQTRITARAALDNEDALHGTTVSVSDWQKDEAAEKSRHAQQDAEKAKNTPSQVKPLPSHAPFETFAGE